MDQGDGDKPTLPLMTIGQTIYWLLFIHEPEVEAVVGVRASDEKVIVYYVYCVGASCVVFV